MDAIQWVAILAIVCAWLICKLFFSQMAIRSTKRIALEAIEKREQEMSRLLRRHFSRVDRVKLPCCDATAVVHWNGAEVFGCVKCEVCDVAYSFHSSEYGEPTLDPLPESL